MQAAIIQFLAELGDRNWVVILFLSAWCPIWGLRAASQRWKEAVLVALGAGLALLTRSLLAVGMAGIGVESYSWARAVGRAVAPVVLWALAAKAYLDYSNANERVQLLRKKEAENAVSNAGEHEETLYNKNVFQLPHSELPPQTEASASATYGATDQAEGGSALPAGSYPEAAGQGGCGPVAFALLVPFLTTLVVAFSDPLQGEEDRREHSLVEPLLAVSGAFAAVALAVLAGTMLERSVSDRRFLLLVTWAIGLSALVATSHATLRFGFGVKTPAMG